MRNIGEEEMVIIYGLKNNDSVKNASELISSIGFPVKVHDLISDGVTESWVKLLTIIFELDKIINYGSVEYQNLSQGDKINLELEDTAVQVILNNPQILIVPIIMYRNQALVGFNETSYKKVFQNYLENIKR